MLTYHHFLLQFYLLVIFSIINPDFVFQ